VPSKICRAAFIALDAGDSANRVVFQIKNIIIAKKNCFTGISESLIPSRKSGPGRSLPLELYVAFLGDRGLLDGHHLSLHLPELGCRLLVTADEKRRWPENYHRRRGSPAILVRWLSDLRLQSALDTRPQFRFETNRRTRESAGFGNSAISGLAPTG
jgi:hypothetical protein